MLLGVHKFVTSLGIEMNLRQLWNIVPRDIFGLNRQAFVILASTCVTLASSRLLVEGILNADGRGSGTCVR